MNKPFEKTPWHKRMEDVKVTVVLTAYNEELAITDVVKDFIRQKEVGRVIVVDNNSKDATVERARAAGAEVVFEKQRGYGNTCIRGLKAALEQPEGEAILLTEADMTFSGRDIKKMLPYLEDVEFVVGNRMTFLVDEDSQQNYFFTWGNWFLSKCLQLRYWNNKYFGRTRLTDVGCTMRLLRREALQKIIGGLKVGGDHFSPHMMMVVLSRNLSLIEIPITFHKRVGVSKGASSNIPKAIRVGLRMLWHIMTFRDKKA
jgi:glycosyltransferase involved in cell wall biosynthesis